MLVTTFASVAVLCYTTETGLFGAPLPRCGLRTWCARALTRRALRFVVRAAQR